MQEATVSSKGQIVIPKNLRDDLGIKEGQKVIIEEVGGTLVVVPVPKDPVKAMKGLIAQDVTKKSSTELVRELRKDWQ